jgi:hypothetical protein
MDIISIFSFGALSEGFSYSGQNQKSLMCKYVELRIDKPRYRVENIMRAIKIAREGKMTATTGEEIDMKAHAILVHGDTPNAIEVLEEIRAAFKKEGIEVAPLARIVG